jgi:ribosome biogenesis GTPase A
MSSIKEEVLDNEDLAIYIINALLKLYPDDLIKRYNLNNINDLVDILDSIGKKIGAIRNKEIDYDRVYNTVINDLREGRLGKITFDRIEE